MVGFLVSAWRLALGCLLGILLALPGSPCVLLAGLGIDHHHHHHHGTAGATTITVPCMEGNAPPDDHHAGFGHPPSPGVQDGCGEETPSDGCHDEATIVSGALEAGWLGRCVHESSADCGLFSTGRGVEGRVVASVVAKPPGVPLRWADQSSFSAMVSGAFVIPEGRGSRIRPLVGSGASSFAAASPPGCRLHARLSCFLI